MQDIHRCLKPGGELIVVIPNLFFWPDRLKLLFGNWQYQKSGTFDYTHLRWYTVSSMKEFLNQQGFRHDVFVAYGWVPLPVLKWVIGSKLRASLNKLVCRLLPGLFGQQLLFKVKKDRGQIFLKAIQ